MLSNRRRELANTTFVQMKESVMVRVLDDQAAPVDLLIMPLLLLQHKWTSSAGYSIDVQHLRGASFKNTTEMNSVSLYWTHRYNAHTECHTRYECQKLHNSFITNNNTIQYMYDSRWFPRCFKDR
jgi:hypothetical protein